MTQPSSIPPSDVLLSHSSASLDDPDAPRPFAHGEIVRVSSGEYSGDPAQILCYDSTNCSYLAKLYPRLDYPGLRSRLDPKLTAITRHPDFRAPPSAFIPEFFGEFHYPLQRAVLFIPGPSARIAALKYENDLYIGPFLYRQFSSSELSPLEAGLRPDERKRFQGRVQKFELELFPDFEKNMEAAFELRPPAVSDEQPLTFRPFALPPRYRAVDGEQLEVEACRKRCGSEEPSFAQLHSRRKLFAAADPAQMRKLIKEGSSSIEELMRAGSGPLDRQRGAKILGMLSELEKLDFTETRSIRLIQQVYFNEFIPIMDVIRNAEIERMRAEERKTKIQSAEWFVKGSE